MLLQLPRSTLFPYTTLFRSYIKADPERLAAHQARARAIQKKGRKWLAEFKMSHGCLDCGYKTHFSALQIDHKDRKSTRLNSSHSQISYAVFCLKKKNN